MQRAEEKLKEAESRIDSANQSVTIAKESLVRMEAEKQAVQNELDDLLMVFGDLEDKSSGYKERLRAFGENVSDVEDGDDNEDEDDAEEDDGVD